MQLGSPLGTNPAHFACAELTITPIPAIVTHPLLTLPPKINATNLPWLQRRTHFSHPPSHLLLCLPLSLPSPLVPIFLPPPPHRSQACFACQVKFTRLRLFHSPSQAPFGWQVKLTSLTLSGFHFHPPHYYPTYTVLLIPLPTPPFPFPSSLAKSDKVAMTTTTIQQSISIIGPQTLEWERHTDRNISLVLVDIESCWVVSTKTT